MNQEPRKEKIVVSLTSFPARLNVVHYTIRSLLAQTCKPDKILLWLTEEECAGMDLPQELENLKSCGLEICYAKTNLRPHNKLYHTLKVEPEAVVISVDDDLAYEPYLIERLYRAHLEHPEAVCCNMAHEITLKDGLPDLYDNWNGGAPEKAGYSDRFVALGVGGVLYPASCFDEEYFDEKLIREFALSADDLWLKITELRLGIPVYKVAPHSKIPYVIGGSQKVALGHENNGMKRNDVIMKKLCAYYQINW